MLEPVPLLVAEDEEHREELQVLLGIMAPEIKIQQKHVCEAAAEEVAS